MEFEKGLIVGIVIFAWVGIAPKIFDWVWWKVVERRTGKKGRE